jgi:mRNA-degrading endonuclease RelE of RelBE toxin-antitoxin system
MRRVDQEGGSLLADIQAVLLENPTAGSVMQGCGGLRKLRMPDAGRGKGKRGGYRVIYLDLPEVGRIHLIRLYDKSEKDDLSSDERTILRTVVGLIKKEVRQHAQDQVWTGTHRRARGGPRV